MNNLKCKSVQKRLKMQKNNEDLISMNDEYFLQDSRQYVGNDVLWWAKNSKGYTTDVSKAHVFTKKQAFNQNRCRDEDIPWPVGYIRSITRPAVDCQYMAKKQSDQFMNMLSKFNNDSE